MTQPDILPPPPAIEATSLAAVLDLASNPPSHPNYPIKSGAHPVVLYIARVPGSRDVFLTPIKPREKVVTAGDVQSSLYYLHVNCEGDYSQPEEQPSSVDPNAGQLPTLRESVRQLAPPLPRRPAPPVSPPYPLGDGPPYPIDDRPPPVPFRSRSPPKAQQIARKPVINDVSNTSPSRQHPRVDLPVLPRRPLPSPPSDDPPSPKSSSLHQDNLRLLRRESHDEPSNNPYIRDYSSHPETLRQLELDSRPSSGTLTLIRRDPGSNAQQNVVSIHDPPIQEVSSSTLLVPTAKRRTKKGGAPVYLDVLNTGYTQFLSRPASRTSTETSASSDSDPPPEAVFRRRLYMPGSRFREHGYSKNNPSGYRKHLSVDSNASSEDLFRKTMRERHSVDMGSFSSSPTSDRRSKGYTFTSPWEGQCEFTTGATGRSLKCRHYLPAATASAASKVAEVSELRFNLPTSSKSAGATPSALSEKRSSYFSAQRFRHHSAKSISTLSTADDDGSLTPSIMIDESTGRIDLSLGQERAGGGFGGKQAKLGKLIIWPEGFGMLDLLVAANLGLWWRGYERGG